jgi:hypothetical protein
MSELNLDPNEAQTQDAQLLAEEIAAGEQPALDVDVDADYEASKEFSTGENTATAEAEMAPQFELSEPEEATFTAEPTGDPSEFRDMAADLNPQGGTGNVDDDLVKKAIELGQPNA